MNTGIVAKRKDKPWALKLLLCVDNFFNVLLLNGNEDQTISGRVGHRAHKSGKRKWLVAQWIINKLFWFDENHCYNSIEWDRVK